MLSERDDVAECAVKERGALLIVVFACRPRKEPHRRSERNFSHPKTRRLILGDALPRGRRLFARFIISFSHPPPRRRTSPISCEPMRNWIKFLRPPRINGAYVLSTSASRAHARGGVCTHASTRVRDAARRRTTPHRAGVKTLELT